MEWGHYNFFPLPLERRATASTAARSTGPAATGPTLSVGEIFAEGRRLGARTIQVNHARGSLGGFTALKIDTDTLATHVSPDLLRMSPQPGATVDDSKLISSNFDALEVLNPGDDSLDGSSTLAHAKFNDWFTLLSRGLLVAGTGVSDTHYSLLATGWRTWVDVGVDQPAQLDPVVLSTRLNALRAITSNGPFVTARAYRVDGTGTMVTAPVGIGGTVAARYPRAGGHRGGAGARLPRRDEGRALPAHHRRRRRLPVGPDEPALAHHPGRLRRRVQLELAGPDHPPAHEQRASKRLLLEHQSASSPRPPGCCAPSLLQAGYKSPPVRLPARWRCLFLRGHDP